MNVNDRSARLEVLEIGRKANPDPHTPQLAVSSLDWMVQVLLRFLIYRNKPGFSLVRLLEIPFSHSPLV